MPQCDNSTSLPTERQLMTAEKAAKLVRQMLACYHSFAPHDPRGYIANLVEVLCDYPVYIGTIAVEVVSDTCKFPPSRAELRDACEGAARNNVTDFREWLS